MLKTPNCHFFSPPLLFYFYHWKLGTAHTRCIGLNICLFPSTCVLLFPSAGNKWPFCDPSGLLLWFLGSTGWEGTRRDRQRALHLGHRPGVHLMAIVIFVQTLMEKAATTRESTFMFLLSGTQGRLAPRTGAAGSLEQGAAVGTTRKAFLGEDEGTEEGSCPLPKPRGQERSKRLRRAATPGRSERGVVTPLLSLWADK